MIIWSGYGILIPLIVIICGIVGGAPFARFDNELLLFGPGLILSAIVCWFLGGYLVRTRTRELADPQTGQRVFIRPGTSLFFIPMRAWGPILGILGVVLIVTGLIAPPPKKQNQKNVIANPAAAKPN
jgi:hypothetical protein